MGGPVRALVTGSAGFIGRHMVRALTEAGWRVRGIDVRPIPAGAAAEAWMVRRDALTFFQNWPLFGPAGRWDLVVHAAAVIGGRAGIDGNPLGMAENLELDAAMFRWAAKARPGRVVYLSSSAAYPVWLQSRPGHLLTEGDVNPAALAWPDALYGWTKLTGELLAGHLRAAGVPVTVVRPFSGYGEDQDPEYPFGAFADRAARRADPFEVWGNGQQVRDFVHVDDVVAAVLRLAGLGIDGPVNIGTGKGTSMLDLAAMFCQAAGYAPEIRVRPDAPAGVACRVADVAALGRCYVPQVTLGDGIARALAARALQP